MADPTIVTWALVVWGAVTLLPLFAVQAVLLASPHGSRSKAWVIGEGEDWGFFVYWGVAAIAYSVLRVGGADL